MRVLVACEYSGTVRDAFLEEGHDAVSCDLLPTESPGPHYEGDVFDIIDDDGWDLMIAHPPCTYMSNSGVRWLYEDPTPNGVLKGIDRWKAMIEGAVFFRCLLQADIPKVAVENPVMHGWAQKVVGSGPSQTIQPYEHGHLESKRTGLWLRGLELLVPTDDVEAEMMKLPKKDRNRVHYASPGEDRWKYRSTFYPGIAKAMAEQWGSQ